MNWSQGACLASAMLNTERDAEYRDMEHTDRGILHLTCKKSLYLDNGTD